MAEIRAAATKSATAGQVPDTRGRGERATNLFPHPEACPDYVDIGGPTWTWPAIPTCKQKPANIKKFDPDLKFVNGGAHILLIVFIGDHAEQNRSKAAKGKRAEKDAARGWGWGICRD